MINKFAALLSWFVMANPAFSEVLDWNCHFSFRVDQNGRTNEKMTLKFKVDTLSQRAFMEGNVGFVEANVFVGDTAFSFNEQLASGAIQTTTIMNSGRAFHSRNTIMLGEIVAAQHFGNYLLQ